MQRFFLTLAFALMAFVGIYAQKTIVWEEPVVGFSRFEYIDIQKVELSKDRTSLYMQIMLPSETWFQFSPQTYLDVDGKHYAITGADGIELGVHAFTSPETMEKEFVLHFKPIPQDTKVFDMLEGTQKGDFTFFYIHPNDYEMPETPLPADFLADFSDDDVMIPQNVFSEDPAVVHIKALNYKKGMDVEIQASFFDITNPNYFYGENIYLDDEGCADYSCRVYYPTALQFVISSSEGTSGANPIVAPGKEVTILIDMMRDDQYPNTKVIGYKGYMSKWYNDEYNKKVMHRILGDKTLPSTPDSYEQYKTVDDLIALHDSLKHALDDTFAEVHELPDLAHRVRLNWEQDFFYELAEYCPSLFNTQEFRDYVYRARPKCFYDDYLLNYFGLRRFTSLFANTQEKGHGPDLLRFIHSMSELNNGIVNPKPLLDDPNLSRLYDQKRQEVIAKIDHQQEGLAKNVHYLELAEVAPENILQALLDRYKGKTVMIDMWATWCGPCLQGHRAMEPVKQELKDKDIVYLYLTYSTSPFDDWKEMVQHISGEHYYLSEEQFDALTHLYQSGGSIPTYAIYDRNGNQTYKAVGFSGVEPLKEGLMKALK